MNEMAGKLLVGQAIYLGVCNKSDQYKCLSAFAAKAEPLCCCFHQEPDDRMMYHLSYPVKTDKYRSVKILPPDTDVLVCAIYNYSKHYYTSVLLNSGLSLEKGLLESNFLYMT